MINLVTPEDIQFQFPYNQEMTTKEKIAQSDLAKDTLEKCELAKNAINKFKAKDGISALTHFIGFWLAIIGMPALLIQASYHGASMVSMICLTIFMLSMIMLYGASTAYHTFAISDKGNKTLKKIDHMMIFILIAGSYTPMCEVVLANTTGHILLVTIWGIAALGITFKALWVTCPRWVSSVIYITMGWAAIFAIKPLHAIMPASAFVLLVAGGVIYTIGGVIYALKLPVLSKLLPGFGAHELFHLFVMGGSICHYIMMLTYVSTI